MTRTKPPTLNVEVPVDELKRIFRLHMNEQLIPAQFHKDTWEKFWRKLERVSTVRKG